MGRKLKSDFGVVIVILFVTTIVMVKFIQAVPHNSSMDESEVSPTEWVPPSLYYDTSSGEYRKLLIYGQDLIANTSKYLGPHGSVARISNGMNCQNCHLNAGRKNFGNNYSLVNATYPKFRARSGTVENIYKRVSDCFERSLNGKAPDSLSLEYEAIAAYIKWVGKDVKKTDKFTGNGIEKLPFLDRAADPEKGRVVYNTHCQSCHGKNGEGFLQGNHFVYPPLWGENSYNDGAGLYRLSSFAGFVKNNMPFNQASHSSPKLTTEEAWDVAAFVNSQPRPSKKLTNDWPDISKKPFDHPFGPYTDGFTESQHKYGPFQPILDARKK